MAAEKQFPLSLVVRAIDKASGPLKAMTAKIEAQTKPFRMFGKDLEKFGEAANIEGFGKVRSALGGVGSEIFGLAARFTGLTLAATLAFGVLAKGSMESLDKLGEVSSRVGTTVDYFASMQHAAAQADVGPEQFSSALDKLNKQLGDMTVGKGGEFLGFLNEISPTFAKQMKAAKGTEAAMALLTDAFAKLDDPAKRATLSAHAFGKSNLQMGEFLHQGSAAITEQQRRFMELVGSQEELVKNAGALDNATRETELAFTGLKNAAVGALFPALTKLSTGLTNFLASHREGIAAWADKAGAALERWVDGGGLERLVDSLGKLAGTIGTVLDVLGPTGVAVVAGAVAFAPLISSVGSLGFALVGVAPQLAIFGTALWGALAPILPFVLAAGALVYLGVTIRENWSEIAFLFQNLGETVRITLDGIKEFFSLGGILSGSVMANALTGGVFGAIDEQFGSGQSNQNGAWGGVSAESARGSTSTQTNNARVQVDFANLPVGARVSLDPNSTQPVNMSMGHTMGSGL